MKTKLIILSLLTASLATAAELVCGTGQSSLADPKAAGVEAALQAKAALGATAPKLVVVFAARKQVGPELVAGVATAFDKAIIYGCEGYSSVTAAGNFSDQGHTIANGVSVLALGGVSEFTVVSDAVEGKGFAASGKRIGEQLKGKPGKLIFTFGNQHVGDNQPFVAGLLETLGATIPVVGAAAGGATAKEIVKGEIVTGVNVAVLMNGAFRVGVGLAGGNGDLVAKSDQSLRAALKDTATAPALMLVFDCGGRRGELVKQKKIADEFAAMKKLVPTAPIFGFYGGGEIGTDSTTACSKGVGFSVAAAALFVE